MTLTDTYTLANGAKIPVVGFGTWQSADGDEAYTAVKAALKAGYRHIDTAQVYHNEASVGKAVAEWLAAGGKREELWITTKLWLQDSSEAAYDALLESLKKLQLDYVDLYLIHWPNPAPFRENPGYEARNREVWKGMEKAVRDGLTKNIGISNFHPHHIDALLKTATIAPVVNQILVNPSDQQEELVSYNKAHNILTEAYSPFGTGKIFSIDSLSTLAAKYHKSVAQIVLAWSLAKGLLPLPKSVTPSRIAENAEIFDISLSSEDIAAIDALKGQAGSSNNPDEVGF
ncbi:MAG: aldo/keto reductase [Streptococcaceae bacterium]|jgi:diketogulonate reductase-like aldo/keto reductase|nr:aldo/keto reductase [Streptococcaceae bacterium]